MINIFPSPLGPYRDFLNGFVNTEQTRLKGEQLKQFGPAATQFNLQDCLSAAKKTSDKVIHAEVTTDEHFYGADARSLPIEGSAFHCSISPFLNQKCLNCIDGWDCESELEPADQTSGREVYVYGFYAYDHGDEHGSRNHAELCRVLDTDHDHPALDRLRGTFCCRSVRMRSCAQISFNDRQNSHRRLLTVVDFDRFA